VNSSQQRFKLIHDASEIPEFESVSDERAFWETHAFSEEFLDSTPQNQRPFDLPAKRRTRSATVTLRMEEDTLDRLRQLAEKKGMGYQTLLKSFVVERLYEEENREGILERSS
jgi:predicted DNA binding CopG/RHH family protein